MKQTFFRIAAVAAFGVALAGCASSPSANTGGTYAPTNSSNVHLYPAGANPICQNYATVGNISVTTLNSMGTQATQGQIDQSLRDQAASMGGTGVMNIQTTGNQQTGTVIHCISRN